MSEATKKKENMIAGNTRRKRSSKGFAEPMTLEQVDSLLAEPWLKEMVAKIRDGDEALKDSLPYICPHYARFKDNHRAQKDIEPETFTFMTCVDVDDKELVDKAIQRAMEVNGDEYSDWQDQVLRIEYSARRKVHIYIRIPKGMTIEEAQQAFCQEIEVPFDESCITPERFIYVTGKDEEVYRSEHWLEAIPEKELEERREAYLQRGLDVDGRRLKKDEGGRTKDDVFLRKLEVSRSMLDVDFVLPPSSLLRKSTIFPIVSSERRKSHSSSSSRWVFSSRIRATDSRTSKKKFSSGLSVAVFILRNSRICSIHSFTSVASSE